MAKKEKINKVPRNKCSECSKESIYKGSFLEGMFFSEKQMWQCKECKNVEIL